MSIFLALTALIFALAHYYCYNRLSFYFNWQDHTRVIAGYATAFLWLCTFASLPSIRMLALEYARPVSWILFPWIGILLLLFITMVIGDVLAGTFFVSFHPSLQDPHKRTFIKGFIGTAILAVTGSLSALALRNGMQPATVKRVPVSLARLPEAFNGFHIVQLTDLHLGPIIDGEWLKDVVQRANALNPDLIALTGDIVDGSVHELEHIVKHLGDLRAKHGVYFITGNHEYYSGVDAWKAHMQGLGIKVLSNERVTMEQNGQAMDLAGVEDFNSYNYPGHGPDLPKALAGRDSDRAVILLAHQPAAIIEAAKLDVDLQISGHTHGGQIQPFNYFVKLRQPYVEGLHTHPGSNTQIYVSDGTGFWGPPMRLGTVSEITSIILNKA